MNKPTREQVEKAIGMMPGNGYCAVAPALRAWANTDNEGPQLSESSQLLICGAWARLRPFRSIHFMSGDGWVGVESQKGAIVTYFLDTCAEDLITHYAGLAEVK